MATLDDAILMLDDIFTKPDNTPNYLNISETVGENDKVADEFRSLILHGDSSNPHIKALQEAVVAYWGTDEAAYELEQKQLNDDWLESGLSKGGLFARTGTYD